jgi:hypothetical protein
MSIDPPEPKFAGILNAEEPADRYALVFNYNKKFDDIWNC